MIRRTWTTVQVERYICYVGAIGVGARPWDAPLIECHRRHFPPTPRSIQTLSTQRRSKTTALSKPYARVWQPMVEMPSEAPTWQCISSGPLSLSFTQWPRKCECPPKASEADFLKFCEIDEVWLYSLLITGTANLVIRRERATARSRRGIAASHTLPRNSALGVLGRPHLSNLV